MTGVNKTIVLTALITAIAPTISSIAAWRAAGSAKDAAVATQALVVPLAETVEQVHKATNSMKDALVASTRKQSLAEGERAGMTRGIAVEKARTAAAQENRAAGVAAEKARPFWKK